jgi:hypothetical protein
MNVEDPLTGLWLSKNKYKNYDRTNIENSNISKHQKPMRPTGKIIPIRGQYQVDLAFFTQYKRFNKGKHIMMNLIHLKSRYLYSFLYKKKSETSDLLIDIIPQLDVKMTYLTVDAGSEFLTLRLKKFLKDNDITLEIINKSKKQSGGISSFSFGIVERVNRTIRDLVERFITVSNRTGMDKFRYEDVYHEIITNYNNSIHSSLKTTPKKALNDIIKDKDVNVVDDVIHNKELMENIKSRFPVGSYVRLQEMKNLFDKGATSKFSDETYKVKGHNNLRVILENDDTYLYHELVKASKTTTQTKRQEEQRALRKQATKENFRRKEGIEQSNIMTNRRRN